MQKIPTKLPLPCGQDYITSYTWPCVCPWSIPSPAPCQAIADLQPDACLIPLSLSHVTFVFVMFICLSCACAHGCTQICHGIRGELVKVSSLLPPCESQGLNSDNLLTTELSSDLSLFSAHPIVSFFLILQGCFVLCKQSWVCGLPLEHGRFITGHIVRGD